MSNWLEIAALTARNVFAGRIRSTVNPETIGIKTVQPRAVGRKHCLLEKSPGLIMRSDSVED